jgi:hypothetical protein
MLPRPRLTAFLATLVLAAASCAKYGRTSADGAERPPARYLFAWTGDEDRNDSDFLTVVDLARDGDRYGTIVTTVPVGEKGLWPHHTEHELTASKMLFANGFSSSRSVLFDLHDPLRPQVVERFNSAGVIRWRVATTDIAGPPALATEQSMLNKGIDDVYAANDLMEVSILHKGATGWALKGTSKTSTWTVEDLTSGDKVWVRARAVNSADSGPWSSPVCRRVA